MDESMHSHVMSTFNYLVGDIFLLYQSSTSSLLIYQTLSHQTLYNWKVKDIFSRIVINLAANKFNKVISMATLQLTGYGCIGSYLAADQC